MREVATEVRLAWQASSILWIQNRRHVGESFRIQLSQSRKRGIIGERTAAKERWERPNGFSFRGDLVLNEKRLTSLLAEPEAVLGV